MRIHPGESDSARDGGSPIDPDPDSWNGSRLHVRPQAVLLVFVGGSLGTGMRWLISSLIPTPQQWPLGILVINVVGAFALALLLERLTRGGPDHDGRRALRLVAGTGFLGGFTTYSALAVDSVLLLESARPLTGLGYAILTLLLGGLASWCGLRVAAVGHQVATP